MVEKSCGENNICMRAVCMAMTNTSLESLRICAEEGGTQATLGSVCSYDVMIGKSHDT